MRQTSQLAATALLIAAIPAAAAVAQPAASAPQRGSSPPPVAANNWERNFNKQAVAIFALLNRQAADWNRGDLDAFATGYKNSPDILFIGHSLQRGYANMLAAYKAHYPTRDAMGTLSFTQLAAQGLDARFATATGHFHLERTTAAGGPQDGYFMLVLEDTADGWKIVRDDTTVLSPQQP